MAKANLPFLIRGFVVFIGIAFIDWSRLGQKIEMAVVQPLEYKVRYLLGKEPTLDPRIKVYAYDDRAISSFRKNEPDIEDWASLLEIFDNAGAKAIFVNKYFGSIREKSDFSEIKTRLERLKTPVIIGSYLSNRKIDYLQELDLRGEDYNLATITSPKNVKSGAGLQKSPKLVYGPDHRLYDVFAGIGHFSYKALIRTIFLKKR